MRTLFIFVLLATVSTLSGQSQYPDFQYRWFINPTSGDTLPYRILYPKGYDGTKSYPLVLFLHGSGERGRDNERQLFWGAPLFGDSVIRETYPAFVLLPQCAPDDWWARVERSKDSTGQQLYDFPFYEKPTKSMQLVLELVRHFLSQENVDYQRMYVTGLSMGGMGTLEIIARLPGIFAAAAPICGGGNALLTPIYAPKTSLWIFHGAKDKTVLPIYSQKVYRALLRLRADVRYTEYPEVEHNAWTPTFADPDFLEWMFSKKMEKWGIGN